MPAGKTIAVPFARIHRIRGLMSYRSDIADAFSSGSAVMAPAAPASAAIAQRFSHQHPAGIDKDQERPLAPSIY
jgi:hypothetical protein